MTFWTDTMLMGVGRTPLVVAAGDGPDPVRMFNTELVDEYFPASVPSGTASCCSFSPGGEFLGIGFNSSPFLAVYQAEGWGRRMDVPTQPGTVNAVSFSPDGSLMAVGLNVSPYLKIYNTSDFSEVTGPSQMPSFPVFEIGFSPNGSYMYIVWGNTSAPAQGIRRNLYLYNVSGWTRRTITPVIQTESQWVSAAFTPNSASLVCLTGQSAVGYPAGFFVFDIASGASVNYGTVVTPIRVALSGQIGRLYATDTGGLLWTFSTTTWGQVGTAVSLGLGKISVTSDGAYIAGAVSPNLVKLFNTSDLSVAHSVATGSLKIDTTCT